MPQNKKKLESIISGSALGSAFVLALATVLPATGAWAGVFNSVHFVSPSEFAIGIEPEVDFSDGAGVATTVRYTQGLTDLADLTALIGTGSGSQQFRIGGNLSFDFFPDIQGQPGVGLMTQAVFYHLISGGQLQLTAAPFVHKSFNTGGASEVEPFLALPFGWAFENGQYQNLATMSFGALFKASEHLSYVAEFGVAINNTQSYFSGGIVYYH